MTRQVSPQRSTRIGYVTPPPYRKTLHCQVPAQGVRPAPPSPQPPRSGRRLRTCLRRRTRRHAAALAATAAPGVISLNLALFSAMLRTAPPLHSSAGSAVPRGGFALNTGLVPITQVRRRRRRVVTAAARRQWQGSATAHCGGAGGCAVGLQRITPPHI